MLGDGTFDYSKDKYAVFMMKNAWHWAILIRLSFCKFTPLYPNGNRPNKRWVYRAFSNLDKSKYEAFAKYFIDIAEHFISEGYPVKYISPINEPQWKWGGDSVWQEGCHYEPKEVFDCYLVFAKELEKEIQALSFTALKAEI